MKNTHDNCCKLENHRGKFAAGERYPARNACVRECGVNVHMPAGVNLARKSVYRPLAKGTTLLVDTANLIGKIGHEQAPHRLSTIADSLIGRGYKVLFFWEHRSYDWTWRNQTNATEVAALKEFVRRYGVALVGEESDLAMLQSAKSITDSVIVTQDRLRDYIEVYPDIVGTSRHRSFSVLDLSDRKLLTIYGLEDAIEIPAVQKGEVDDTVDDFTVAPEEEEVPYRTTPPVIGPTRWGMLGVVDDCLSRGSGCRALAILDRMARKNPKYYREIADAFESGCGVCADARVAARYDRLADRGEKALRQLNRRKRRRSVERRRGSTLSWSRAA